MTRTEEYLLARVEAGDAAFIALCNILKHESPKLLEDIKHLKQQFITTISADYKRIYEKEL